MYYLELAKCGCENVNIYTYRSKANWHEILIVRPRAITVEHSTTLVIARTSYPDEPNAGRSLILEEAK